MQESSPELDTTGDRVRSIVAEHAGTGAEAATLDDETRLLPDLIVDSASLMSLVVALEEEFDILVGDEELREDVFADIGSLTRFVETKL